MKLTIPTVVLGALITVPALAEETRSADAHEHGHGTFNMAVERKTVAIELETPAFDLLGFEHEAKSDADKAAIDSARDILADPMALFGISGAAECRVAEAEIEIGADADHHEDGHGDDHHDDEHHDDEHHGEDKSHDDHADDAHDHKDEEHAHDDHGDKHDDHAGEESDHSEVHAHYTLTCGAPGEINGVNMAGYFKAFPNAEELDAAILTDAGQTSGELEPDSPELSF